MKKAIFRLTNIGLLLSAIIALGAVAGIAQTDPCTDAAGMDRMQKEFDDLYADKVNLDVRQKAIDSGKEFLEKYGACDPAKIRADWLRVNIPKMEKGLAEKRKQAEIDALTKPFDAALQASGSSDAAVKAKGYDDAFNLGQQILAKWPDDYRTVEIVLAAMAGDEGLIKSNYKYADQGLRFAKQAIADLEANKGFAINGQGEQRYGLSMVDPKDKTKVIYNYSFKDKNGALGWMNLYVGNILFSSKKDKVAALPYLYKTTQFVPDNPSAYALIGYYYIDQLNAVVDQIAELKKQQDKPDITEDELKGLLDQIKAKIAISNGISERVGDAFARAYKIATDPAYKTKMKQNVDAAYFRRFGKNEGVDAWIATTIVKPFENPTTPIAPISDPEPVKTTGEVSATGTPGTGAGPATSTNGVKPATVTPPVKTTTPPKTTTATPAPKKPRAAIKNPVAKKRKA